MKNNLGFRSWYYFRMGWSTYFAFIFAAINTLTVTYYLAIEKYPGLEEIFPNFIQYVVIVTVIGIPLLVVIGYAHYKRTKAFQSENDILVESNPYQRRTIVNTEIILQINLKVIELLLKQSKNEQLNENELQQLAKLQSKLSEFVNSRTFSNNNDLNYLKKEISQ